MGIQIIGLYISHHKVGTSKMYQFEQFMEMKYQELSQEVSFSV